METDDSKTNQSASHVVVDDQMEEINASGQEELNTVHDEDEAEEESYTGLDPRNDVLELLEEIDAPGSFACSGECDHRMDMPGLLIDGMGILGLPLSEDVAQKLASCCEQSPFGRGEATVVDTKVRKTLQLEPSKFQVTNPAWQSCLDKVISSVRNDLGVQDHIKVEAQLYKMLLYEPGSFFKPHRDSEKVEGMFGTLVIILPTSYSGGELVVHHSDETKSFDQGENSAFCTQYAAFYADCQHELKVLESGNRLCIVYNLVKGGNGPRPTVHSNSSLLKPLRSTVRAWAQNFDGNKLVIMTDHLYTKAGMSDSGTARFKGRDAAVVEFLESAQNAGVDLDWDNGTISYHENGYADEDDCSYGVFTWADTTDSTMKLELDTYGKISIDQSSELVPEDFYEGKEAEEEFEPTGNEGVTAERQYDDEYAIVIWPRSCRWEVLTDNDISKMIEYVKEHSDEEASSWMKEKLQILADKIAKLQFNTYGQNSLTETLFLDFMKLLAAEDDSAIGRNFIKTYVPNQKKRIPVEIATQLSLILKWFDSPHADENAESVLVECINNESYSQDPNKVVAFIAQSNRHMQGIACQQALTRILGARMVECMRPEVLTPPLKLTLTPSSTREFLNLLIKLDDAPGAFNVTRDFIERLTWASCQHKQITSHFYISRTETGKGPIALCNAPILECCAKFGWKALGSALEGVVKALIQHGSSNYALSLVRELDEVKNRSNEEKQSDRSIVCSKLASLVIKEGMKFSGEPSFGTLKDLLQLVEVHCTHMIDDFVDHVLKLDVDKTLIHLVILIVDEVGSMQDDSALSKIALHCVNVITKRTLSPMPTARNWSISDPSASTGHAEINLFLKNPCRIELDMQLAKTKHRNLLMSLQRLVGSGVITAESHRPGGHGFWYVRIKKLTSRQVIAASFISCSCPTHFSGHVPHGQRFHCAAKANQIKVQARSADTKMLNKMLEFLSKTIRRVEIAGKLGVTVRRIGSHIRVVQIDEEKKDIFRVGDKIVSINGTQLADVGKQEALTMLEKSESKNTVEILFMGVADIQEERTARSKNADAARDEKKRKVVEIDLTLESDCPTDKKVRELIVLD